MYKVKDNRKTLPGLTYYQAKSEIDDITSKFDSYQVYYDKQACEAAFPESIAVEMVSGDIEMLSYIDLVEVPISHRSVAEAFLYASEQSFDTQSYLDDKDSPILSSDYVIGVFKKSTSSRSTRENMYEWLEYIIGGDIDSSEKENLDIALGLIEKHNKQTIAIVYDGNS